jgi:hypothetical protein
MLAINKRFTTAIFIAASTSSLFAAKAREQATVVDNVVTQHSYEWSQDGSAYVSCGGNSCYAHFHEAQGGTATVNGATLNLQFASGNVAVASAWPSTM